MTLPRRLGPIRVLLTPLKDGFRISRFQSDLGICAYWDQEQGRWSYFEWTNYPRREDANRVAEFLQVRDCLGQADC
jgi:hypothetical protein